VITGPHLGHIKADPGHVNQVIMNLVVNARDAMLGGGTLTVETRDTVTEYGPVDVLSVTDTGIGMDEATRSRIFEPFFTTKDKSKGTGLGLSTVFGIVEQSGGTMAVHSKPGRGATFEICFPRCDETIEVATPVENRPLRGGETILLVDDDAQVRKVATAILQRSGYRVLAARSGPDAILQYHQRLAEVDLLLGDVVMPEMSGRELADRLGTIRPDLRVLYMSGYTDDAISHHRVLDPGSYWSRSPSPRRRYSTAFATSCREPSYFLAGFSSSRSFLSPLWRKMWISTRRLSARPASVLLSAIGRVWPSPFDASRSRRRSSPRA